MPKSVLFKMLETLQTAFPLHLGIKFKLFTMACETSCGLEAVHLSEPSSTTFPLTYHAPVTPNFSIPGLWKLFPQSPCSWFIFLPAALSPQSSSGSLPLRFQVTGLFHLVQTEHLQTTSPHLTSSSSSLHIPLWCFIHSASDTLPVIPTNTYAAEPP